MSVLNPSTSPELALHAHLRIWDRRLRLVQSAVWLPRSLFPGLLLGIVLALIAHFYPSLTPPEIVVITALAVLIMCAVSMLILWFYPRSPLQAAQRFDREFGLRERMSAAYELLSGRIQTNAELNARQVEDALVVAAAVRPQQHLPIKLRGREWLGVLGLAVVLAVLLLLPNPQAAQVTAQDAQQAALEAAAETVREITRDVATDPNLDDPTRQQLLEALQSTLETLQQAGLTPEEAFATLSEAQDALENAANNLGQNAEAAQAGLQASADALRGLPTLQQEAQSQSLAELLDQLGVQSGQFDPAQRSEAANALNQAADSLQGSNPQTAQAMRDAAESLENGSQEQAAEALDQAQQSAENAQQQAQQAQNSAQQLEESAQQAQQAGQQVGQEQGGQQSQGQSGQQNSGEQSNAQNESGQSPSSDSGESNQSGEQAQSEPQSGQSSQAQTGQQSSGQAQEPGQQAGQQGQQSSAQSGQQGSSASNAGQTTGDSASVGSGAGDDPGGAGQVGPSGVAAQQQSQAMNNPDGAGERPYEPVYAPSRIGGEADGPEIQLEADSSDLPVQEGNFSENPTGQASVPYNQVFGSYAEAANRALESDYVPLGLRDVVRDYFTGLEPGR